MCGAYAYDIYRNEVIVNEANMQKITSWTIMLTCIRVLVLTSAASSVSLNSSLRFTLCGIGCDILLLSGLVMLTWIDQDDLRTTLGTREVSHLKKVLVSFGGKNSKPASLHFRVVWASCNARHVQYLGSGSRYFIVCLLSCVDVTKLCHTLRQKAYFCYRAYIALVNYISKR
ncbi:AA-permease C-terminal domain-containing protein [Forsythia ovata]|uniref:AA-permease C-terminal domain-containing protein n=1 Tax=Forsythia ovata TaxID=205694 RepID=A0ABD1WZ58_9LAMI